RRGFNAVSGQLNEHPLSHTSLLRVQAERDSGAIAGVVYVDGGLARLSATSRFLEGSRADAQARKQQVFLTLHIAEGWHVASQDEGASLPLGIEASEYSAWALEPVCEDNERDYRGERKFSLMMTLKPEYKQSLNQACQLSVTIQLCSDTQCLLAHEVDLLI
ncbi:MAG: hypothetical protein ACO3S3_11790, partial [Pseudohongiellaceae bacterium]